MYTVLVTGLASTHYPFINKLDGFVAEGANFSEYGSIAETFAGVVTGGNMYFKAIAGELYTHTEYQSTRKLTQAELTILASKTQGQWSDGFGEGFEQNPVFNDSAWDDEDGGNGDVYVSPWCRAQKVSISQVKA